MLQGNPSRESRELIQANKEWNQTGFRPKEQSWGYKDLQSEKMASRWVEGKLSLIGCFSLFFRSVHFAPSPRNNQFPLSLDFSPQCPTTSCLQQPSGCTAFPFFPISPCLNTGLTFHQQLSRPSCCLLLFASSGLFHQTSFYCFQHVAPSCRSACIELLRGCRIWHHTGSCWSNPTDTADANIFQSCFYTRSEWKMWSSGEIFESDKHIYALLKTGTKSVWHPEYPHTSQH